MALKVPSKDWTDGRGNANIEKLKSWLDGMTIAGLPLAFVDIDFLIGELEKMKKGEDVEL